MKATDQSRSTLRPGRNLRIILLLGFGGLFLLLIVSGWEALSSVKQIHAEEQEARRAFAARDQSLLAFRSSLDIYGNRIDEYFLSYSPALQSSAADELPQLARKIRQALDNYPADRQPAEAALLTALEGILGEQEKAISAAVSEDRSQEHDKMVRLLYDEVLPRSQGLATATEKVAIWNHQQLMDTDEGLLHEFSGLRTHLMRLLLIVLASGLALSIGSIVYIMGQDREARQRYHELTENRNALSELSARVVDAQEEERRAISRELHDEVGQSLGALLVDLGRVASLLPPDSDKLQNELRRMKTAVESSVNSVRNMALLLRPSMLDDLGLIPALEWQAREVSRRSDIEVEIESKGVSEGLDEKYKICIYRLTQEALNNAARHSGGHHAWVTIEQRADRISVTVQDDGQGFVPQLRGLGLLGMDERVRRLGGQLRIDSAPGKGTTLVAGLPL
jgi:signal transduction histidine kinase